MKSREEVELLKSQWGRDAIWDIEDTEGFEDYRNELLIYRFKKEAEWKEKREQRHAELASKLCPLSFGWINWNADEKGEAYTNCKVEECAWWNDTEHCCAIRALNLRD